MGKFKFTRTKKRRFWQCPKKVHLRVDCPGKAVISKTRKKYKTTQDKLNKMDSTTKRKLLENKGILKQDSNAPQDLVSLMLSTLV